MATTTKKAKKAAPEAAADDSVSPLVAEGAAPDKAPAPKKKAAAKPRKAAAPAAREEEVAALPAEAEPPAAKRKAAAKAKKIVVAETPAPETAIVAAAEAPAADAADAVVAEAVEVETALAKPAPPAKKKKKAPAVVAEESAVVAEESAIVAEESAVVAEEAASAPALRPVRAPRVFPKRIEDTSRPVPPSFPSTEYAVVEKLLVGFVRSEVRKVGLERAVLGLSGGIDSAVSAAIAARALGPANVVGVMMPYQASSPESLADAREVAAALGIDSVVVDITKQIDAYFAGFADASRLRRGNKMARERMTILYDRSAADSALVVGTSNKTELLLGYGTLYGDMASALNPIGDLYKTQVWGLARHLGLPASVIDKAPTADLWSGQTDENELGFSYLAVDQLLFRMIDERCSNDELVGLGFDATFVERISRMVRSSQFKRRLPIIAKLSARSIDTDFRYSRDWGL